MTPMEMLMREAESYLERGDLDRAAEIFKFAPQVDGGESRLPTLGLARVAIALGRLADAALILETLLTQYPELAQAHSLRGVVHEAHGKLDAALASYRRAVEFEPRNVSAQFNLGRVLGQLERFAEAVPHLRAAHALEPNQYGIAYALGMVSYRSGDLKGALLTFSACIRIDENNLDGYVTLADVLADCGRPELAEELLANASERFPASAALFSKRAALALRANEIDEAISLTQRQLELTPKDESAWLGLALLCAIQVDLEGAMVCARKVLELNPRNWQGWYQLGAAQEAMGAKAEAKKSYGRAVDLAPREWRPKNNLAALLLESTDRDAWSAARLLLTEAITLAPAEERSAAQYNLALLLWRQGDRNASLSAARAAAAGPPVQPEVIEAKRFLGNFV